jgi:hypothetical protein
MLVTPRPGVNRENLLQTLRHVSADITRIDAHSPQDAHKRLLRYLEWTGDAVQMLSDQTSAADLDRLVLTRRYQQLLSGVGTMAGTATQRVVNGLVSLEIRERTNAFEAAVKALDKQINRWKNYAHFALPDTSFYVRHEHKLELVDFGPILDAWESPITILVPAVVIDELDKLKESNKEDIRWRAGYTLAVFDRVCAGSTGRGQLRAGEPVTPAPGEKGHSPIDIEIVFDPPGHVRLPINDDEIVDRALAVQALAGRDVTLLTYDTGQSSRGRFAGLQAVKLSKPLGEEPHASDSKSRRGERRARASREQSPATVPRTDEASSAVQ